MICSSFTTTTRKILRCFQSPLGGQPLSFARLEHQHAMIQMLVRVFYGFALYDAVIHLGKWKGFLKVKDHEELWPVMWMEYVGAETGVPIILGCALGAAFLGILFVGNRWVRLFIFFSLLQFIALKNSYGKINHGSHLLLLISFFLIFLPHGWNQLKKPSRLKLVQTCYAYTSVLAMIMLSYTMAGVGKVALGIYQWIIGETHAFSPESLALHIAQRLVDTNEKSLLGDFFIEHAFWVWPLMLTTIYLQFFSIWAAMRPSLHQLWAFSLIGFHIMVSLTMGINFTSNCWWLAIFFIMSPLSPERFCVGRFLSDLPVVGWIYRKTGIEPTLIRLVPFSGLLFDMSKKARPETNE